MADLLRVGVMASGRGTDLQSIIDACETGSIQAEVVVLISNRRDAFCLERARKHSITAEHVPSASRIPRSGRPPTPATSRSSVSMAPNSFAWPAICGGSGPDS